MMLIGSRAGCSAPRMGEGNDLEQREVDLKRHARARAAFQFTFAVDSLLPKIFAVVFLIVFAFHSMLFCTQQVPEEDRGFLTTYLYAVYILCVSCCLISPQWCHVGFSLFKQQTLKIKLICKSSIQNSNKFITIPTFIKTF